MSARVAAVLLLLGRMLCAEAAGAAVDGACAESAGEQACKAASAPPARWPALRDQPGLLDGPGLPVAALRRRGVDLAVSYTEFGQSLVSGDGEHGWRFGGKMLGKAQLDGSRLHLWKGFSINATGEVNNGSSRNGVAGSVLMGNAALAFPQDSGVGGDLSLNVTQRLGKRYAISVGKFDMINAPAKTPLLGGGGLETFWNIAFAAPPSGVLPPYVVGGTFVVSAKRATWTFMLYDPNNAQQKAGLRGWGEQGVTGRVSARVPVKIGDLPGFHTFTFAASSQAGFNLDEIPQLALPPESVRAMGDKRGYSFGGYALQQYLYQDRSRAGAGWGLFAQGSMSEANPNPIGGNLLAGVAETGLPRRRPLDRAGVGYFRYFFSDSLKRGLRTTVHLELGDEYGMEAFYNAAITRWLRIAADLQLLRPGNRGYGGEVLTGLNTQIRF